MGNSLRCCLACVIPCGALDLIRIVHLNGFVEEITHPITAGDVLKANPNHVLSKPCSQGVSRKILILSPDSELKRGSIYFLIPESSMPPEKKKKKSSTRTKISAASEDHHEPESGFEHKKAAPRNKVSRREHHHHHHHHRRSGSRIGDWRPQLQSITED